MRVDQQPVDRLDRRDTRPDENRGHDEVAGAHLRLKERSRNAAPSGTVVSASPNLWIRSASSAALEIATNTASCATAVTSNTTRLSETARNSALERLIEACTSPWL